MDTNQSGVSDNPGPSSQLKDLIFRLKSAIWRRRPVLGEIMQRHGDDTLYDYSMDFMDVNPTPGLERRKAELIATARELITDRLGADVAAQVARQLTRLPLVSTADHHGPITHPLWVNANIISALPYSLYNHPDVSHLVVFSFASVSINNHTMPRGIVFHGTADGSGPLLKLPILPDRIKMSVAYGLRPFTREDIDRAIKELEKKTRAGEVEECRAAKIKQILETHFASPDILEAKDFCSQITRINHRLWPQQFHPAKSEPVSQGHQIPHLIYLEIETLVTELLTRFHLRQSHSHIHKLLFHEKYQEPLRRLFNNIPGAFSHEQGWGTHLFWGIDESGHRVRLSLVNGQLVSPKGALYAEWSPAGVADALKNKKIMPAMVTCYLMVSLYYGMKCLGGFCQVNDLTMTKRAWQQLLAEVGEHAESAALEPIQTKELGGDGMILAYMRSHGRLEPASGIDLLLDDGNTAFGDYHELSKKATMTEMMNPMLPEMYTVLYSMVDREAELATITPHQIMAEASLREKIRAKHERDEALQRSGKPALKTN